MSNDRLQPQARVRRGYPSLRKVDCLVGSANSIRSGTRWTWSVSNTYACDRLNNRAFWRAIPYTVGEAGTQAQLDAKFD